MPNETTKPLAPAAPVTPVLKAPRVEALKARLYDLCTDHANKLAKTEAEVQRARAEIAALENEIVQCRAKLQAVQELEGETITSE